MHIPDGVLDTPVCAITGALAAAAFGYGVHRSREQLADRTLPLTGMTASMIFAAQMVNFPLFVAPVSGHLVGGVLAAAVLGPWAGCVAIGMVLFVQTVLFADGGWTSLGANFLNMGILGCWGGGAVLRTVRARFRDPFQGLIAGAVWGAWFSVLGGAALFCLEFAASSTSQSFGLRKVFLMMIVLHALIGIGEGVITSMILSLLYKVRPDLLNGASTTGATTGSSRSATDLVVTGILLALAIAACLAPFASSSPDGLEHVGTTAGFEKLARETRSFLWQDYLPPGFEGSWEGVGTALAGITGTLAVLVISSVLVHTLRASTFESGSAPPGPQQGAA